MSAQIDNSKGLGDRTDSEQWFIKSDRNDEILDSVETWGAFASQSEAIAKRVGLIRAGKCTPQ